jgi:hypothetical protein
MTWLSVEAAALLLGYSEGNVRRLARLGKYESRRVTSGKNALALEIRLTSLGPAAVARWIAEHPEAGQPEAGESQQQEADCRKPASSWSDAPQPVRDRAVLRLEAVLSWREAEARARTFSPPGPIAQAREAWLAEFARRHPRMKVSLASVRRWDAAYRSHGRDGLLDGNDGSARAGRLTIAPHHLDEFRAEYLQPSRPTIAGSYTRVKQAATARGEEIASYHAFRRHVETIPQRVLAAFREEADSSIRPYVIREYDSLPAYHTLQSDHHQIDVAVHCGDPLCNVGHYPWWTVWVDVRSRRILASELYVGNPNSRRVLSPLKRCFLAEGPCVRLYLDNGLDYKKAAGWGVRHRAWGKARKEFLALADWTEERLLNRFAPVGAEVMFATPYNAQAKLLERTFKTWIGQFHRSFESYRGELGQRSERAEYLRKHPHELPTLGELVLDLDRQIAEYNATPHRGRGMKGRCPDEVFNAHRAPRRDVDPMALALVFYDVIDRTVRREGVQFKPPGSAWESQFFKLDDDKVSADWFGRKVLVWYDEDDLSELVVTDLERRFLSLARPRELASNFTSDEHTVDAIKAKNREWAAIKRLIAAENPAAGRHLESVASSVEDYHQLREAQQQRQVAAAGGASSGVVHLLPHESKLSRQVEEARTRVRSESGVLHISSADLELARQIEGPSNEQLQDYARRSAFALSEPYHRSGRGDVEDAGPEPVDLAARRHERALDEKIEAGLCGFDLDCEAPIFAEYVCEEHWNQLYARD